MVLNSRELGVSSPYAAATDAAFRKIASLGFEDSDSRPITIYWPYVDVSGKPDSEHIRVEMRKTQPDKQTVERGDCGTVFIWILQVSVVVKENLGQIKPDEIIDQVVDAFPFGSIFGTEDIALEVVEAPNAINGVDDGGGWIHHPVQIRLMKTNAPINDEGFLDQPDDERHLLGTVDW